jgi:NADPH:quinone reductase-like Zn-dependent oxidoreductase
MRAFVVERYGKNGLRAGQVPEPELRDSDVLVRVRAAGINPLDSKIRDGEFKLILPYRPPFALGHDVAGVVTRVGPAVRRFTVGDEVYARPHKDRVGTFAELGHGRARADPVVEVAGTLESSLAAVALGGEIAVVGFVGGCPAASLDPYAVFTAGATLRPIAVGSRSQLAALVTAVSTHRIRPVLGRVFPFDDAPAAFRHYLGGTALGKVVITLEPTHDNGRK